MNKFCFFQAILYNFSTFLPDQLKFSQTQLGCQAYFVTTCLRHTFHAVPFTVCKFTCSSTHARVVLDRHFLSPLVINYLQSGPTIPQTFVCGLHSKKNNKKNTKCYFYNTALMKTSFVLVFLKPETSVLNRFVFV